MRRVWPPTSAVPPVVRHPGNLPDGQPACAYDGPSISVRLEYTYAIDIHMYVFICIVYMYVCTSCEVDPEEPRSSRARLNNVHTFAFCSEAFVPSARSFDGHLSCDGLTPVAAFAEYK